MRLSLSLLVVGALLCLLHPFASARAGEMSAADAVSVICPGRGALAPLFQSSADRHHVPAAVLVAQFRIEASCNAKAVNVTTKSFGAMGIKLDGSANVDHLEAGELMDPATNIDLGARHLRRWARTCGSLAGSLSIYHGRTHCRHHRGDRYVGRVLGLAEWARRQLRRLQEKRS